MQSHVYLHMFRKRGIKTETNASSAVHKPQRMPKKGRLQGQDKGSNAPPIRNQKQREKTSEDAAEAPNQSALPFVGTPESI